MIFVSNQLLCSDFYFELKQRFAMFCLVLRIKVLRTKVDVNFINSGFLKSQLKLDANLGKLIRIHGS